MTETTSPPVEVEIKLAGSKGALRAAEAILKRQVKKVTWKIDDLSTVYYDTTDRRLSRRGVSYRVRRKGKTYLQTVKAPSIGSGALALRPEWEMEIRSSRPALELLPAEARTQLGLVLPGELRKLFTVNVTRKKAVVDYMDSAGRTASLEIAVDRGTVSAGRKSDEITEVEIELVSGDADSIYELAAHLAEAGLSVSRVSKAQRGFIVLEGAPVPEPKRAPKLALVAGETASDALARIFSGGIANVLDNEAATLDGTDPEGVHQMRVSLRRMRSILSVFKNFIDAERVQWARDELKWLANELGPARDWDVFADEILKPVSGAGIDPNGIAALIAATVPARADGYKRARAAIASVRYTKLILGISQFAETRAWMPADAGADHPLNKPLQSVAGGILSNAFKKLKKRGKGLAKMDTPERHEVRIALKKFRYSVDSLQGIYPASAVAPFTQALGRMQDKFGHLNDVSVAETLLSTLTDARGISAADKRDRLAAAGQVVGWHARGVHDEEDAFLRDWKNLIGTAPFWEQP